MRAARLANSDIASLERLLLDAPEANLLTLGYARSFPLDSAYWYGVFRGDDLDASVLVVPNRIVLPFARDPAAARELGRYLNGRHPPAMLVGGRDAADAFWQAFAPERALRVWFEQRLFVARTRPLCGLAPGFRHAEPRDLATVHAFARAMEHEDLGYWPDREDPEAFRRSTLQRIEAGQTWVIERSGEIIFQIHVEIANALGAQVGGTWVPKHHRGKGIATAGMRSLCAVLLQRVPFVTLHVNEANLGATTCYKRSGFEPHTPLRLLSPEDATL